MRSSHRAHRSVAKEYSRRARYSGTGLSDECYLEEHRKDGVAPPARRGENPEVVLHATSRAGHLSPCRQEGIPLQTLGFHSATEPNGQRVSYCRGCLTPQRSRSEWKSLSADPGQACHALFSSTRKMCHWRCLPAIAWHPHHATARVRRFSRTPLLPTGSTALARLCSKDPRAFPRQSLRLAD